MRISAILPATNTTHALPTAQITRLDFQKNRSKNVTRVLLGNTETAFQKSPSMRPTRTRRLREGGEGEGEGKAGGRAEIAAGGRGRPNKGER